MNRFIFWNTLFLAFFSFQIILPFQRAIARKKRTPRRKSSKRTHQKNKTSLTKTPPWLERKRPFRSRRCWLLYKKMKKLVLLWQQLEGRLQAYHCDPKEAHRCRFFRFLPKCRDVKNRLRWDYCFRIERKLRVFFRRFLAAHRKARSWKCRWKMALPRQRYAVDRFPYLPKRFSRRY